MPGAGRTVNGNGLPHLGHGFVTRLQHRPCGRLHDPADRGGHGEPLFLRGGDSRGRPPLDDRPFAPEGVEDAAVVKTARATEPVPGAIGERWGLIAEAQAFVSKT